MEISNACEMFAATPPTEPRRKTLLQSSAGFATRKSLLICMTMSLPRTTSRSSRRSALALTDGLPLGRLEPALSTLGGPTLCQRDTRADVFGRARQAALQIRNALLSMARWSRARCCSSSRRSKSSSRPPRCSRVRSRPPDGVLYSTWSNSGSGAAMLLNRACTTLLDGDPAVVQLLTLGLHSQDILPGVPCRPHEAPPHPFGRLSYRAPCRR